MAWMFPGEGVTPRGPPNRSRRMRIASGLGSPITVFTTAGSASIPQAARVARNDVLTASPSYTVVPARSKTASLIMVNSQPVGNDALRQAERQGHAGPADAGHGHGLRVEVGDDVGGGGMLDVGPVPAGGDGQVG